MLHGRRQALPEGLTHLTFSMQLGQFSRRLKGSEVLDDLGSLQAYFANLGLRHYLGRGLSVDLLLPTGLIRFKQNDREAAHYITGLGDIELGARYDLAALWGAGGYSPSVALRGALGLPSGTQDEVKGTAGVTPNQVLAIGLATFTLRGSLEFTQFLHRRVALLASAGVNVPLSTTSGGIHFPPMVHWGAGGLWRPVDPLTVVARVAGNHAGHTRRQDGSELPNSGGVWLAAELSAGWRINRRWSVGLGVRVPFMARVNGTQLTEEVSVLSSVGLSFGVGDDEQEKHEHGDKHEHGEGKSDCDHGKRGDEHEHGHEHGGAKPDRDHGKRGDKHEHGHGEGKPCCGHGKHEGKMSGDVKDIAVGGKSFVIWRALVPGKVTVIDFWAEWCKPCKAIDHELRKLARRHRALAVRRVEVPDFDSPVAKEHLRDVGKLPVVWIYDKRGARAFELVNQPLPMLRQRIAEVLAR